MSENEIEVQAEQTKPAEEPKAFKRPKKQSKKKVCIFCQDKLTIDYKDANRLRRFITEKGKILPRRQTGVCSEHQRELALAIKRARIMAILPFQGE